MAAAWAYIIHGGFLMNVRSEVERLIDAVRSLEDRVRELEQAEEPCENEAAIGFDVDFRDDFDEDDTEYVR